MSAISRITKKRLFEDEALFNSLLPFAKFDSEYQVFVHGDASIWALMELQPRWLTKTSDAEAYQLTQSIQEILDALDSSISVQWSWVTTFDVEDTIKKNLDSYPTSGSAGWMAHRWARMIRRCASADSLHRRPRRHRLIVALRYDPPWKAVGWLEETKRSIRMLLQGAVNVTSEMRRREYKEYVDKFRG